MLPYERLSDVFDRALSEGIESLSNDERELYLIQDFIIELEMGGLSGYFYNRLALTNHIAAAIVAMDKYGLSDLAELLSEALQVFGSYAEPGIAKTWSEILKQYDPGNRLAIIEKQMDSIEDYGIENSLIE